MARSPDLTPALGQSVHDDAYRAGQDAAEQALAQLVTPPSWALAFAGGQHDGARLLAGLRGVLGATLPIVGGSTVGLITGAGTSASGYECGLLLFPQALAPNAILIVDGLERDETEAGEQLGRALLAVCPPGASVLLSYDSIHSAPPTRLHMGSRLIAGMHRALGGHDLLLFGGGTLSNMEMTESLVFDGRAARKHCAVAVVLPDTLECHLTTTHGCLPASDFMEITRLDGAYVLELDGQPALTAAAARLRLPRAHLTNLDPSTFAMTLGEKRGDPYAPFDDRNYVNRLVVATDPQRDALILTEDDFRVGSRVQLMAIDPERMIDSARAQTARLLGALGDADILFGLYIDCAGRSMAYSGMEEDESSPVRALIGGRCPLLGFYSGVEIAPVNGVFRPLDWTGVLALFLARSR